MVFNDPGSGAGNLTGAQGLGVTPHTPAVVLLPMPRHPDGGSATR